MTDVSVSERHEHGVSIQNSINLGGILPNNGRMENRIDLDLGKDFSTTIYHTPADS